MRKEYYVIEDSMGCEVSGWAVNEASLYDHIEVMKSDALEMISLRDPYVTYAICKIVCDEHDNEIYRTFEF